MDNQEVTYFPSRGKMALNFHLFTYFLFAIFKALLKFSNFILVILSSVKVIKGCVANLNLLQYIPYVT